MRIAIVGASGVVGRELAHLLKDSEDEVISFNSNSFPSFQGIDLAYFCVSSELAKTLIPLARKSGTICIDSSSAFRLDPSVPLVIPEINPHTLKDHQGIIASPNCTTTLMLLPLAPLHKEFQIKRIFAATYQAISGAGGKAKKELEKQSRDYLEGKPLESEIFSHPCAFTVFPHESAREEERKMVVETHKILEDPTIAISAMCTRVPVFRVHSIALSVEFTHPITAEVASEYIDQASGVELKNCPISIDAEQKKIVLCGRVRADHTQANTIELWVVGDQILKGAALNMMQIAESLGTSYV